MPFSDFEVTVELRTPLISITWDGQPSGYAANADNWIFL